MAASTSNESPSAPRATAPAVPPPIPTSIDSTHGVFAAWSASPPVHSHPSLEEVEGFDADVEPPPEMASRRAHLTMFVKLVVGASALLCVVALANVALRSFGRGGEATLQSAAHAVTRDVPALATMKPQVDTLDAPTSSAAHDAPTPAPAPQKEVKATKESHAKESHAKGHHAKGRSTRK